MSEINTTTKITEAQLGNAEWRAERRKERADSARECGFKEREVNSPIRKYEAGK